jgi:hypothetical protein
MNGNRGGLTGIGGGLGQYDKPRDRFTNVSGEEIPPYAVLKITETDGDNQHALEADKPDGTTTDGTFRLNMGRLVATGKSGTLRSDGYGMWALYDSGDGTPAPGESWGPGSDWELHKDASGFVIVGGAEAFTVDEVERHRVRVAASGAASVTTMLMIESATAATYNATTNTYAKSTFNAIPEGSGGFNVASIQQIKNPFPDAITCDTGKGRIIRVSDGELIVASCTQVDLPEMP